MAGQIRPIPPPAPMTAATKSIGVDELAAISVLGRGGKGVVFLVRHLPTGKTFALKAISRFSIENKDFSAISAAGGGGRSAYRRICFERDVLLALDHSLFPSLYGVVCTEKIVGFVIDHCPGGDLNALRRRQTDKMFSDEIIRFYAAELVLALEHLHRIGIVYRDLKPENVLIQENGHLMLVDFDLSTKLPSSKTPSETQRPEPHTAPRKKSRSLCGCLSGIVDVSPEIPSLNFTTQSPTEKSNSFVGTEDYVAPEIIEGKGHDFSVDWWCLGIVLYEMLYGRTPFQGSSRKETFYRILTKSPDLVGEPTALRDLIGRLLVKDPAKRIDVQEIRRHEFFRGLDWALLVEVARPPFIPAAVECRDSGEILDVEKVVEEIAGRTRAPEAKVSERTAVEEDCLTNRSRNSEFDDI